MSGSRNYGLDLAKERGARFIQFFDDDDIMHPQKLELQVAPLLKKKDLDLTICCYRKFERIETVEFNLEKANDGSCKIVTDDLLRSFYLYQINLNSCGPLWRADKIQLYRFREELSYAEERDFYLRIFLNEELNYFPVTEILFWYRKHPDAITSKLIIYNKRNFFAQLSNQKFLEEVLQKRKAPLYILKSYIKFFIKNRNTSGLKKIKLYLMSNKRWQSLEHLKLLIYIQLIIKRSNG